MRQSGAPVLGVLSGVFWCVSLHMMINYQKVSQTTKVRVYPHLPELWVDSAMSIGNTPNKKWAAEKKTVYHKFDGRLGNTLFQFASISGIASANNAVACFDRNALSDFLEDQDNLCIRTAPSDAVQLRESKRYGTHMHFKIERDTLLEGFLQSFRYFQPEVWKQIKIKKKFQSQARIILTRVLGVSNGRPRVAIHIRKLHQNGETNFIPSPENPFVKNTYLRFPAPFYFEHAMAYMRAKHPLAVFIVLSDHPEWCRTQTYLQHPDVHVVLLQNPPALDLAIITECDHAILTRGTFGWWGAFLGASVRGGSVVYNAGEFDMQHPINAGNVILSDFYPPHWIAIPVGKQLHAPNYRAR